MAASSWALAAPARSGLPHAPGPPSSPGPSGGQARLRHSRGGSRSRRRSGLDMSSSPDVHHRRRQRGHRLASRSSHGSDADSDSLLGASAPLVAAGDGTVRLTRSRSRQLHLQAQFDQAASVPASVTGNRASAPLTRSRSLRLAAQQPFDALSTSSASSPQQASSSSSGRARSGRRSHGQRLRQLGTQHSPNAAFRSWRARR